MHVDINKLQIRKSRVLAVIAGREGNKISKNYMFYESHLILKVLADIDTIPHEGVRNPIVSASLTNHTKIVQL